MKLKNPVRDIRTIKQLLTGAEAEARQMGDTLPGAEHLLLSALALADGSARRVFERLGAGADGIRSAIVAHHAEALQTVGVEPIDAAALLPTPDAVDPPTGAFRSSASAQGVFQEAVKVAKRDKASRLVGAHVVVAVAQMEHGTAAEALRGMGIDRHALAAAAWSELGAGRG